MFKSIHLMWFCCHSTRKQVEDKTLEKPLEKPSYHTEQTEDNFLLPQLSCVAGHLTRRKHKPNTKQIITCLMNTTGSEITNLTTISQKIECFWLGLLISELFAIRLFCGSVECFPCIHHPSRQNSVLHHFCQIPAHLLLCLSFTWRTPSRVVKLS